MMVYLLICHHCGICKREIKLTQKMFFFLISVYSSIENTPLNELNGTVFQGLTALTKLYVITFMYSRNKNYFPNMHMSVQITGR